MSSGLQFAHKRKIFKSRNSFCTKLVTQRKESTKLRKIIPFLLLCETLLKKYKAMNNEEIVSAHAQYIFWPSEYYF